MFSVTFGSVFVASDQQLVSQSGRLRSSAEACLDTILKRLEKKDWKSLEILSSEGGKYPLARFNICGGGLYNYQNSTKYAIIHGNPLDDAYINRSSLWPLNKSCHLK
jgi:hypothetical protein